MQLSGTTHHGREFTFDILFSGGIWIGESGSIQLLAPTCDQTSEFSLIVGLNDRSVRGSKALISLNSAHISTVNYAAESDLVLLDMANKKAAHRQLPITSQIHIRMTTPEIADAFVRYLLTSTSSIATLTLSKYDRTS